MDHSFFDIGPSTIQLIIRKNAEYRSMLENEYVRLLGRIDETSLDDRTVRLRLDKAIESLQRIEVQTMPGNVSPSEYATDALKCIMRTWAE